MTRGNICWRELHLCCRVKEISRLCHPALRYGEIFFYQWRDVSDFVADN